MIIRIALPTFLTLTWLAATAQQSNAADSDIIAPGAKVEMLADGFKFTEGPACDAEGNVYFTDQAKRCDPRVVG